MINITKYKNCHVLVKIYNNVTFMVKLLVNKKAFEEILGYSSGNNAKNTNMNLFQKNSSTNSRHSFARLYLLNTREQNINWSSNYRKWYKNKERFI